MTTYIARDRDHNYLAHHGVKGMKWGVRRYRNRSGALTAAGKARLMKLRGMTDSGSLTSAKREKLERKASKNAFISDKKKSTHRLKLEEKYKASGMSDEDAKLAADGRIRLEKKAAVVGAVAATAAVAVYANHRYHMKVDDLVVGTKDHPLYRMQVGTGDLDSSRRFYATNSHRDHEKYVNWGSGNRKKVMLAGKNDPGLYSVKISKEGGFKIMSEKKSADLYKKLKEADPQTFGAYRNYNDFNTKALMRADSAPAYKKFTEAVKKAGYDGVIDMNDRYNSGFGVENPVVVFENASGISASGHKLADDAIRKSARAGWRHIVVDRAPVVAGKTAVATAITMPWIPAAIAGSTRNKRAKEKADIIKTRTKGK